MAEANPRCDFFQEKRFYQENAAIAALKRQRKDTEECISRYQIEMKEAQKRIDNATFWIGEYHRAIAEIGVAIAALNAGGVDG
jgi:DNA-binding FadR family transcriptional regulator